MDLAIIFAAGSTAVNWSRASANRAHNRLHPWLYAAAPPLSSPPRSFPVFVAAFHLPSNRHAHPSVGVGCTLGECANRGHRAPVGALMPAASLICCRLGPRKAPNFSCPQKAVRLKRFWTPSPTCSMSSSRLITRTSGPLVLANRLHSSASCKRGKSISLGFSDLEKLAQHRLIKELSNLWTDAAQNQLSLLRRHFRAEPHQLPEHKT